MNRTIFTIVVMLLFQRSFTLQQRVTIKQFVRSYHSKLVLPTSLTRLYSTTGSVESSTPIKSWDLKGLKSEVNRSYLRTFKKVGKASERYDRAKKEVEDIMKLNDDEVSVTRLEQCPNPEKIRSELIELQELLAKLFKVEEDLKSIKTTTDERFVTIATIVAELGISDQPPPLPERGPKKPKGAPPKPRMPYHTYRSVDGLEIRVGRGASDNDELSCNPVYRDGADWWMHVSGCAGSHVVIRSHDDQLPTTASESLLDAAYLAVVNSKASQSGKIGVSANLTIIKILSLHFCLMMDV